MVFFERYDFAVHDVVLSKLIGQGTDVGRLQEEHSVLLTYAISGACPKVFPTVEEYKHHMRRVIVALKDVLSASTNRISSHSFKFHKKSSALLIDDHDPIGFTRNKNPSVLLGYLSANAWESVSYKEIENDLGFSYDQTERTVRQINDRIPNPLPPFLCTPDHPDNLEEKIVVVSPSYGLNT